MSDYVSGGTGPHYYQEIYADPHRFDVVYHANVTLGRTTDGGANFEGVGSNKQNTSTTMPWPFILPIQTSCWLVVMVDCTSRTITARHMISPRIFH